MTWDHRQDKTRQDPLNGCSYTLHFFNTKVKEDKKGLWGPKKGR